jgi:hypothetical protein
MPGQHPALLKAGVAGLAWIVISQCAPPKDVDYDAPDASQAPDAPVYIKVDPPAGKENVDRRHVFRITFDKHLNSRTLTPGRLSLSSGMAGRWTLSYYDPVHKQLVAWPAGPMLRQSTWILTLNKGIDGLNGLPVYPGELTWFRTGDDAVAETAFKIRSYETEVKPIFQKHCISCHGGGGEAISGLRLDSESHILETAINEPAIGWQDWTRIVPTRPGESYLLMKIVGDENLPGKTMPRSLDAAEATPLTTVEKDILMEWIAGGTPFFDPE